MLKKQIKNFSISISAILLCIVIISMSALFTKTVLAAQVQFTADTIVSLSGISDGDLSVRANSECDSLSVSGAILTITDIPIANNFILKTATHNNALKLVPSVGVLDLTLDSGNISSGNITEWTLNAESGTTVAHIVGVSQANTWYAIKTDGVLFNTFQSNSSGEVSFVYNGSWSEKVFTIETDSTAPAEFSLVSPVDNSSTSDSSLTFSWNASSDPDLSHYQLYIDNILDTNNISGTSATSANTLSCGNHSWYVKAIDNASNSTDSNTFNLTMVCGGSSPSSTPPVIFPLTFTTTIVGAQLIINLSNVQNACQIAISLAPDFENVSWEPYQEEIALPNADKVYFKFRSLSGGVSEVYEIEVETKTNNLPNGSLARMVNDFKVYIINHNYKRHILDGDIFNFYGHLNWNTIQEVNPSQLNNYQESFLIRELNDYKVYEIRDNKKHWLNITVEEFEEKYDWDEIYVVNEGELGWYGVEN